MRLRKGIINATNFEISHRNAIVRVSPGATQTTEVIHQAVTAFHLVATAFHQPVTAANTETTIHLHLQLI